jgi:hypothetical protein
MSDDQKASEITIELASLGYRMVAAIGTAMLVERYDGFTTPFGWVFFVAMILMAGWVSRPLARWFING